MLYVDIPSTSEFRELAETRADACVSIYLPTSPITQEAAASRTEFRNLVGEATGRLAEAGLERGRLPALRTLLDELGEDDTFWRFQARSLAVLATPESLRTFRLPNRLSALNVVGDRFHLRPLLRAITFPHEAFVLALSENAVRLVEVFADLPAQRVSVADLPSSAGDAVRSANVNERSPRGRLQGSEGQKVQLRQYARQVDAALRPLLAGRDAPLIIAATEPMSSIFRSVTTLAPVAPQTIAVGPDRLSEAELATLARPILDATYARDLDRLREQYNLRRSQRRATRDVADAAVAATFGAIEGLMVDIDAYVPGTIDEVTGRVSFGTAPPGQEYGVVDEIAKRALLSGARVLGVRADDLPGSGHPSPLAATLRYTL